MNNSSILETKYRYDTLKKKLQIKETKNDENKIKSYCSNLFDSFSSKISNKK